jgi:GDP-4-dehydro-6-deoxy-D-mannose reductase
MRLLLTGATGFVAPYVADAARQQFGAGVTIFGAAQAAAEVDGIGAVVAMDLASTAQVDDVFTRLEPTHVIHLGGISAFQDAERDYETTWNVNVLGALRCARALERCASNGVFVFVGSAQVYARGAAEAPLDEASPLAPIGEYAVTKAAADVAMGGIAHRGLKVVRFRPFNHTGPGQTEEFVAPRFAAQIARIEAGLQPPTIRVGNLRARRDFLDVRDVARAYVAGLARADDLESGVVFNLASGRLVQMRWILDYLVSLSRVQVAIEEDPALWRPNEASTLIGSAEKAAALLHWRPTIALETTLQDVLEHFRATVAVSGGRQA